MTMTLGRRIPRRCDRGHR